MQPLRRLHAVAIFQLQAEPWLLPTLRSYSGAESSPNVQRMKAELEAQRICPPELLTGAQVSCFNAGCGLAGAVRVLESACIHRIVFWSMQFSSCAGLLTLKPCGTQCGQGSASGDLCACPQAYTHNTKQAAPRTCVQAPWACAQHAECTHETAATLESCKPQLRHSLELRQTLELQEQLARWSCCRSARISS